MPLYAHWLDGEYVRISKRLWSGNQSELSLSFDRILKLHALFGTRLVLSDVQVIDCGFLLDSFADPHFRAYLDADPAFLSLVAKPSEAISNRFAIATVGLRRAQVPGWESSAFSSAEPIRELGAAILQVGATDPASQLLDDRPDSVGGLIRKHSPQTGSRLHGVLHAVHHFAGSASRAPVAAPPADRPIRSYFQVLTSVAGMEGMSPQHERAIDLTLAHVEKTIEDERARYARSSVLRTLDTVHWPLEHQAIWHTAVHAWNCAVQETIGAQGASIGHLPYSAPVGIYVENPTDALIPTVIENGRLAPTPFGGKIFLGCLSWDPALLGWDALRQVVDKTSRTRDRFAAALQEEGGEGLPDALADHVAALAPCFERNVLPEVAPYQWWIAAGAALLIGGVPPATAVLGARPLYEDVADALKRGYEYRVANTLRSAADRIAGMNGPAEG